MSLLYCIAAMFSLFVLPDPYGQLDLDDKQSKQAEAINARYVKAEQTVRGGKALDALRTRRDAELDKLLTDEQKSKAAVLRKQMKDGVPLGQGLYRSYKIEHTYKSLENINGEYRHGAKVTITNRSGKTCNVLLMLEGYDLKGVRIANERAVVRNLEDNQSDEVSVTFDEITNPYDPQKIIRLDVKLVDPH